MRTGIESYYALRALEYDQVYEKTERQDDIARLKSRLPLLLAGRHVLEIAAGTGYWTDVYADDATSVVATDINAAVLEVARRRRTWCPTVEFVVEDAFALRDVTGPFDAAFVGFFWSHIPLAALDGFLATLAHRLEPGADVVIVDNCYVDGSNHPIAWSDVEGNTYQQRTLSDGSIWGVLKNFPSEEEVREQLARFGTTVEATRLQYYWLATFRALEACR